MVELTIAFIVILVVSAIMSITGRGGGNFYVPVLGACGLSVLEAATTAQCILFTTALASLLVFQRSRTIDWKLALIIDPPTDIMALIGGYYAHRIPEHSLKLIFAVLLVLSGILMLQEIKDKKLLTEHKLGFWRRVFGEYEYVVNLWLVIPITAAARIFCWYDRDFLRFFQSSANGSGLRCTNADRGRYIFSHDRNYGHDGFHWSFCSR